MPAIVVQSSRLSSTFPKKNPTARRVYKKGGHTASGEDTKQFLSATPEPVCATVKLYRDSIRKSTLVVEQLRRVRCTSPTLYDDCGYQGQVSDLGGFMARIDGVDPLNAPQMIKSLFENQKEQFGGILNSTRVIGLRPTIVDGSNALSAGIEASGLIEPSLRFLVCTKTASINGCPF